MEVLNWFVISSRIFLTLSSNTPFSDLVVREQISHPHQTCTSYNVLCRAFRDCTAVLLSDVGLLERRLLQLPIHVNASFEEC
jgi:hypothetical protein